MNKGFFFLFLYSAYSFVSFSQDQQRFLSQRTTNRTANTTITCHGVAPTHSAIPFSPQTAKPPTPTLAAALRQHRTDPPPAQPPWLRRSRRPLTVWRRSANCRRWHGALLLRSRHSPSQHPGCGTVLGCWPSLRIPIYLIWFTFRSWNKQNSSVECWYPNTIRLSGIAGMEGLGRNCIRGLQARGWICTVGIAVLLDIDPLPWANDLVGVTRKVSSLLFRCLDTVHVL